jgi:hypothetical protein
LHVQSQMELTFVQGRWGVEWSPDLIFPQLSDGAHLRLVRPLPSRGNIYDRSGLGLAVQGPLVELGVVPAKIQDETALLAQLEAILKEDAVDLQARYATADPSWYVPLGRVSAEAGQSLYEALNSTPGIDLREGSCLPAGAYCSPCGRCGWPDPP